MCGGGGSEARPQLSAKKKYHFLLLLPFDVEAFKTSKNTIKHIDFCGLPCLGLDLWLTLKVYFGFAYFAFSLSNLLNYFSVTGLSNKKNSPLCGGHHTKLPLFFSVPQFMNKLYISKSGDTFTLSYLLA